MEIFCNLVGFPIVKHAAQFLALFCLLELECLVETKDEVAKRTVNPRTRGLRELKGLISSVNYDGISSRSRNRVSSNVVRGVGNFK